MQFSFFELIVFSAIQLIEQAIISTQKTADTLVVDVQPEPDAVIYEHESEDELDIQDNIHDNSWRSYPQRPIGSQFVKMSPRNSLSKLRKPEQSRKPEQRNINVSSCRIGSIYGPKRVASISCEEIMKVKFKTSRGPPDTSVKPIMNHPFTHQKLTYTASEQTKSFNLVDFDMGASVCGHDSTSLCQTDHDMEAPAFLAFTGQNTTFEIPCQVTGQGSTNNMFKVQVAYTCQNGSSMFARKECPRDRLRFATEPITCHTERNMVAHQLRQYKGILWQYDQFLQSHPKPHNGYIHETSTGFGTVEMVMNILKSAGNSQQLSELVKSSAKVVRISSNQRLIEQISHLLSINEVITKAESSVHELVETIFTSKLHEKTIMKNRPISPSHENELKQLIEGHFHIAACNFNLLASCKTNSDTRRRRLKILRAWKGLPTASQPSTLTLYRMKMESWSCLNQVYLFRQFQYNEWSHRFVNNKQVSWQFEFERTARELESNCFITYPILFKTLKLIHEYSLDMGSYLNQSGDSISLFIEVEEFPVVPDTYWQNQRLHASSMSHLLSSRWLHPMAMMLLGLCQGSLAPNGEKINFYVKDVSELRQSSTFLLVNRCIFSWQDHLTNFVVKSLDQHLDTFLKVSCFNGSYRLLDECKLHVYLEKLTHRHCLGFFHVQVLLEQGAIFEPKLEFILDNVLSSIDQVANFIEQVEDPSMHLTPIMQLFQTFKPLLELDPTSFASIQKSKDLLGDGIQYSFERKSAESKHPFLASHFWATKCQLDAILTEAIEECMQVLNKVQEFENQVLSGIHSAISHVVQVDVDVYAHWFASKLEQVVHGRPKESSAFMFEVVECNESDSDESNSSDLGFYVSDEEDVEYETIQIQDSKRAPFNPTALFPQNARDFQNLYSIAKPETQSTKMLKRCKEELIRLEAMQQQIQSELPSIVLLPLFKLDLYQAKIQLIEFCSKLLLKIQDQLYSDASDMLKSALSMYSNLEETLQAPIENTEDLSTLWRLQEDLEKQTLAEIKETFLDPAFARFSILDEMHYIRPQEGIELEKQLLLAPTRIVQASKIFMKQAKGNAERFKMDLEVTRMKLMTSASMLVRQFLDIKNLVDLERAPLHAETLDKFNDQLNNSIEEISHMKSRLEMLEEPFIQDCRMFNKIYEPSIGVAESRQAFDDLIQLQDHFLMYHKLWSVAADAVEALELWNRGPFFEIDSNSMQLHIQNKGGWLDTMEELSNVFERYDGVRAVCIELQWQLVKFKENFPMIKMLLSKALRSRHWKQITAFLDPDHARELSDMLEGGGKNENGRTLTLGKLQEFHFISFDDEISKVCLVAEREYQVENALAAIHNSLEIRKIKVSLLNSEYMVATQLNPTADHESIFQDTESIVRLLDSNLIEMRQLLVSPFCAHMRSDAQNLYDHIIHLRKWIKQLSFCQGSWNSIKGVFRHRKSHMGDSNINFTRVENTWDTCTKTLGTIRPSLLELSYSLLGKQQLLIPIIPLRSLVELGTKMEILRKDLWGRMDIHRNGFSRLYFLSNDQLLDLISSLQGDPLNVKRFLPLLFFGVSGINTQWSDVVNPDRLLKKHGASIVDTGVFVLSDMRLIQALSITSIATTDSSCSNIDLCNVVVVGLSLQNILTGAVFTHYISPEVWLADLDHRISATLKVLITETVADADILNCTLFRTQQVSLVATQLRYSHEIQQLYLTKESQDAVVMSSVCINKEGVLRSLTTLETQSTLLHFEKLSKKLFSDIQTVRKAIRELRSHNRDDYLKMNSMVLSLTDLYETMEKKDEFTWESRFRYTVDGSGENIAVVSLGVSMPYSYQLQSVHSRLVIAPITLRCMRNLMVAANAFQIGCVESIPGGGKTATLSELAHTTGNTLISIHPKLFSDDSSGLEMYFQGISKCHFWGVLEFNGATVGRILNLVDTFLTREKSSILFCTSTPTRDKSLIPSSILESLRSVVLKPDFEFVSRLLIYANLNVTMEEAAYLGNKLVVGLATSQELIPSKSICSFIAISSIIRRASLLASDGNCRIGFVDCIQQEIGARTSCANETNIVMSVINDSFETEKSAELNITKTSLRRPIHAMQRRSARVFEGSKRKGSISKVIRPVSLGDSDVMSTVYKLNKDSNYEEIWLVLVAHAAQSLGYKWDKDSMFPICLSIFHALGLIQDIHKSTSHPIHPSGSIVIAGSSFSGKSTVMRIVLQALNLLKVHNVRAIRIFTDSMHLNDLVGGNSKDGIIFKALKSDDNSWIQYPLLPEDSDQFPDISSDLHTLFCHLLKVTESMKWLIFDGNVSCDWIDGGLDVLMDEADPLFMFGHHSMEFSVLPRSIRLIFETSTLENASPSATAKSCIICVPPQTLQWQYLVHKWMNPCAMAIKGIPQPYMQHKFFIQGLFDWLVPTALTTCVPTQRVYSIGQSSAWQVTQLLALFTTLLIENQSFVFEQEDEHIQIENLFVFALIWTIGAFAMTKAPLREDDQHLGSYSFEVIIRNFCGASTTALSGLSSTESMSRALDVTYYDELVPLKHKNRKLNLPIPEKNTVYDYYYDVFQAQWVPWEGNNSPSVFSLQDIQIYAPSQYRSAWFLKLTMKYGMHVFCQGGSCSGRTTIINSVLADLTNSKSIEYHCKILATTPSQLKNTLLGFMKQKRPGEYEPVKLDSTTTKPMYLFVEDLNVATPVSECVRQILEVHSLYDESFKVQKLHEIGVVFTHSKDISTSRNLETFRADFSVVLPNISVGDLRVVYTAMFNTHFNTEQSDLLHGLKEAALRLLGPQNPKAISLIFRNLLGLNIDNSSAQDIVHFWLHQVYCSFILPMNKLVKTSIEDMKFTLHKFVKQVDIRVLTKMVDSICETYDFLSDAQDISEKDSILRYMIWKDTQFEQETITSISNSLVRYKSLYIADYVAQVSRIVTTRSNSYAEGIWLQDGSSDICRMIAFEVATAQGYDYEEPPSFSSHRSWHKYLRELMFQIGSTGTRTVLFIDHHSLEPSIRQDLEVLLQTGDLPDIFKWNFEEDDKEWDVYDQEALENEYNSMKGTWLDGRDFDKEDHDKTEERRHLFILRRLLLVQTKKQTCLLDEIESITDSDRVATQQRLRKSMLESLCVLHCGGLQTKHASVVRIRPPVGPALVDLATELSRRSFGNDSHASFLSLFARDTGTSGVLENMSEVVHCLYSIHNAAKSKCTVNIPNGLFLKFAGFTLHWIFRSRKNIALTTAQLGNALAITEGTNVLNTHLTSEIAILKPQLDHISSLLRKRLESVVSLRRQVGGLRASFSDLCVEWEAKNASLQQLGDEIQASVDFITPVLSSTSETLAKVHKSRLVGLNNIKNPNQSTRVILQCIYMAMTNETLQVRDTLYSNAMTELEFRKPYLEASELVAEEQILEDSLGIKEYYLNHCRKLLGNPHLPSILANLKKDSISKDVIDEIGQLLESTSIRDFFLVSEENVLIEDDQKSTKKYIQCRSVLEALVGWLLGLVKYRHIVHVMLPKQQILVDQTCDFEATDKQKSDTEEQLKQKEAMLEKLQSETDSLQNNKLLLNTRMTMLEEKMTRSGDMFAVLGSDTRMKWTSWLKSLKHLDDLDTADGMIAANAILASAASFYFGYTKPSDHAMLGGLWMELLLECGLKPSISNSTDQVRWSLPELDEDATATIPLSVSGVLGNMAIYLGTNLKFFFPFGEIMEAEFAAKSTLAWIESGNPMVRSFICKANFLAMHLMIGDQYETRPFHSDDSMLYTVPLLYDPDELGLKWYRQYIGNTRIIEIDFSQANLIQLLESAARAEESGCYLIITNIDERIVDRLPKLHIHQKVILCSKCIDDSSLAAKLQLCYFDFSVENQHGELASCILSTIVENVSLANEWLSYSKDRLRDTVETVHIQKSLLEMLDPNRIEHHLFASFDEEGFADTVQATSELLGDQDLFDRILVSGNRLLEQVSKSPREFKSYVEMEESLRQIWPLACFLARSYNSLQLFYLNKHQSSSLTEFLKHICARCASRVFQDTKKIGWVTFQMGMQQVVNDVYVTYSPDLTLQELESLTVILVGEVQFATRVDIRDTDSVLFNDHVVLGLHSKCFLKRDTRANPQLFSHSALNNNSASYSPGIHLNPPVRRLLHIDYGHHSRISRETWFAMITMVFTTGSSERRKSEKINHSIVQVIQTAFAADVAITINEFMASNAPIQHLKHRIPEAYMRLCIIAALRPEFMLEAMQDVLDIQKVKLRSFANDQQLINATESFRQKSSKDLGMSVQCVYDFLHSNAEYSSVMAFVLKSHVSYTKARRIAKSSIERVGKGTHCISCLELKNLKVKDLFRSLQLENKWLVLFDCQNLCEEDFQEIQITLADRMDEHLETHLETETFQELRHLPAQSFGIVFLLDVIPKFFPPDLLKYSMVKDEPVESLEESWTKSIACWDSHHNNIGTMNPAFKQVALGVCYFHSVISHLFPDVVQSKDLIRALESLQQFVEEKQSVHESIPQDILFPSEIKGESISSFLDLRYHRSPIGFMLPYFQINGSLDHIVALVYSSYEMLRVDHKTLLRNCICNCSIRLPDKTTCIVSSKCYPFSSSTQMTVNADQRCNRSYRQQCGFALQLGLDQASVLFDVRTDIISLLKACLVGEARLGSKRIETLFVPIEQLPYSLSFNMFQSFVESEIVAFNRLSNVSTFKKDYLEAMISKMEPMRATNVVSLSAFSNIRSLLWVLLGRQRMDVKYSFIPLEKAKPLAILTGLVFHGALWDFENNQISKLEPLSHRSPGPTLYIYSNVPTGFPFRLFDDLPLIEDESSLVSCNVYKSGDIVFSLSFPAIKFVRDHIRASSVSLTTDGDIKK